MLSPGYLTLALLVTPSLAAVASGPAQTPSTPLDHPSFDLAQVPIDPTMPGITEPLDYTAYPPAPPSLALRQVHVFVRHGERTPVSARMYNAPANIPESWLLCRTARYFRAAVHGATDGEGATGTARRPDGESLRMRKVLERADGSAVEDECLLGELTDIGRQSTYNFGVALRKLYIDRLGFLPDVLGDDGKIYFRSTNMPRTIESLEHVIHGLYPTSKRVDEGAARILVRNGKDENLIGNSYACKRLEILLAGFADAAASAYNPVLEGLDEKLSKYIDGAPLRVDGRPRASGVMDTIRAAIANGIKVPPEFLDKSVVDTIEKAVVSEWFNGYQTEEVRRLGMGRLLADLSQRMQNKAAKGEQDPLKLLVLSTHDTGIAALCQTLDVFDDRWPAFTASVTFELFKQKQEATENASPKSQSVLGALMQHNSSTAGHYVRMRYQNKTLALPICAEAGKHLEGAPEFCTLDAFRQRVAELTPKDWIQECASKGRS